MFHCASLIRTRIYLTQQSATFASEWVSFIGCFRIRCQKPQHDVDAQNHCAGAAEEELRAVPHVAQDGRGHGAFVGRQLHDEHRRLAFEQGFLEHPRYYQRHHRAEQIHREQGQPLQAEYAGELRLRHARGDEHGVDRQPRRAAHQRRDEDGHEPVLRRLDGARGHDAGDGAGVGTQHRDEALAVQADLAHQAVHEERRARHVAGVFQQANEAEEQQNLRQEDDDRADAGDDALHEQVVQVAGGHAVADPFAEAVHHSFNPAHRNLRKAEDALKHQRHEADEDGEAPDFVREDAV